MPITTSGTTITFNDATTQSTAATSAFPAGTVVLFYQAAAPTGWTQVTTQNNKALRVVSGTGGGTGGTTGFTSVFTNQTPTITTSGLSAGATTLSTPQIPSHTHPGGANIFNGQFFPFPYGIGNNSSSVETGAAGGGGSHSHPVAGSASASAITLNVQYIDIILASKD